MTRALIAALILLALGIAIGYATRPDAPLPGYYGRQQ